MPPGWRPAPPWLAPTDAMSRLLLLPFSAAVTASTGLLPPRRRTQDGSAGLFRSAPAKCRFPSGASPSGADVSSPRRRGALRFSRRASAPTARRAEGRSATVHGGDAPRRPRRRECPWSARSPPCAGRRPCWRPPRLLVRPAAAGRRACLHALLPSPARCCFWDRPTQKRSVCIAAMAWWTGSRTLPAP